MSDTDNRNATEEAPEQFDGEEPPATPPPATAEEVQELKDRLLRTLAEMENLRARTQREVEEARKFAVTGFARDLLEVGDNLGRALASVPAEARAQSEFMTNLVQGVEMTERSLRSALERHQVRRVSPQKGERFDHKLHQAMFEVPSAELAPGSVAEVIQDGYVLADRLLRPALVGVAKAPPDASPEQPGNRIDQSA
jgi:molecular chaperone GrpE